MMIASGGSRPRRSVAGPMAVALLVVGAGPGAAAWAVASTRPSAQPRSVPAAISIAVDTRHTEGRVSKGFIGFSYPSGGVNSGNYAAAGNLPALLSNLGMSVMRFGGNSVDHPSFQGITSAALSGLAGLAKKTGWKVLYSVNLGYFNAATVKADVHNVAAKLGANLYGVACGNEPEDFPGRERPDNYTEQTYLATDVPACYHAVHAGAPNAPFTGPNTFHTSWLAPYAAAEKGILKFLVEHYYPMTNCHSGQNTAAELVSTSTMAKEIFMLGQVRAAAVIAKVPFIVGETNSASCGGIPGLSDTYASALWASSWLMTGAEHGAHAMYFNGSLSSCITYAPLCTTGGTTYTARPVYYGLLFAHLMGTGWTLPVTTPGTGKVAAFAVRNSPGHVRVMVQNLTGASVSIALKVPGARGTASTLRLAAPSLTATTGVRIQGAAVTAAGTFRPGPASHIGCAAGTCHLTLPAYTAVIVILPRS